MITAHLNWQRTGGSARWSRSPPPTGRVAAEVRSGAATLTVSGREVAAVFADTSPQTALAVLAVAEGAMLLAQTLRGFRPIDQAARAIDLLLTTSQEG